MDVWILKPVNDTVAMDPALLREREAFRKKALNAPLVEARKRPAEPEQSKSRPSKKVKSEKEKPPSREFDYKTSSGSSQYKFAILAKIVRHLKALHQSGIQEPISIDDILEETNQTDIGPRNKHWLVTEALLNNPKVEVVDDGYKFRPIYNVRDKKGLLALLKEHEVHGLGTITMEAIEESVPNVAKVMRDLKDLVHHLVRQADKKEMICLNNKAYYPPNELDEEVLKTWRSVPVEGVDERKIEEYLKKHNITAMQNIEIKKATIQKKKPTKKRARAFKSHNEHMGDILKDYSQK